MMVVNSKNVITSFLRSRLYELFGLGFLLFSISLLPSLLTHSPTDSCWNLAVDSETQNCLGSFGAILSDLFLQSFGFLSYVLSFFFLGLGLFLFTRPKGSLLFLRTTIFLIGFSLLLASAAFWEQGGAVGYLISRKLYGLSFSPLGIALILLGVSLPLLLFASGLRISHIRSLLKNPQKSKAPVKKKRPSYAPQVEEAFADVKNIPKD